MTLNGFAGLNFNINEVNTTLPTGTVNQVHLIDTSVGSVNIGTTDIAVSMYGWVGANSYQLNLKSINNVTGAGTGIDVRVDRNNAQVFANARCFYVYNASSSNNLILKVGATSSYFPASDQITLIPGAAQGFAYSNVNTVGATSSVISITGGAASTYHKIYILGN